MTEASKVRLAYSDPRGPIRLGVAVLILFIAGLAGWSVFVPLSDAAVARGSLAVEGRSQAVQHPFGGVVASLAVEDGETVERGDVLMTLSDTQARAQRDVLLTKREALRAQLARLIAERDGIDAPDYPEAAPDAADAATEARATQTALLASRLEQHRSAVVVVERRIDQLRQKIAGAEAEAEGLTAQVGMAEAQLADASTLLDKGLARRPQVLDLERQVSTLKSSLAAKRSESAAAAQSVAEAQAEIARLDRDRQAAISQEIEVAQAELAAVAPQIDAAADRLERMQVRAPATGRVVGLSVFTEGGVVEPGATLMQIVPSQTPFIVQGKLALTDLHDIREGQPARLELLAFPRSDRPELHGTVATISADAFTDDRTGSGYYAVTIRPDPEQVAALNVDLQSGMPVEIIMDTRARTLIAYLTSPLLDQIDTAFRED
ncbi:HlyD family type I secretion periplasmic adaptor subunit [Pseudooceanicola sp.]|uniref:HlyD family type I secretion periplasmic adaptor subunit n=1 Tax=Pseudooceanicola sp. TaxID=1914328 RepID=UPI0035C6CC3D